MSVRNDRIKKHKIRTERIAALAAALDAGREHYRDNNDLNLIIVHRTASARYPDDRELVFAFAEGYQQARRAHDDYKRGD